MGSTRQIITNLNLPDLGVGEQGVIIGYERSQGRYLNRLLAMGLTRGTLVRIVRKAPMGDPIDVSLRGYRLTLRKEEAKVLFIERTAG